MSRDVVRYLKETAAAVERGKFSTPSVDTGSTGHRNAEAGVQEQLRYHVKLRARIAAGSMRQDDRASAEDIELYRRAGWDDERS